MMQTRLRKKKQWDRQGVSEVIGTILTLSITVVLFSTIIAMVNMFPPPGDNVFADFSASIDWIDGGGAYIEVTHAGGMTMEYNSTRIIVAVGSSTYTMYNWGVLGSHVYGIGPFADGHTGPDNGDKEWDAGEIWVLEQNSMEISQNSDVSIMIIDTWKNMVAWTATIQGNKPEFGPVISDIWVDSNLGTIRHDPVEFGRIFYLYAKVSDSDGDLDNNSVTADLSAIDPFYNSVQLFDQGGGIFRSMELNGPQQGIVPIGYHLAVVYAEDTAGHHSMGTGRIAVGQDIGDQPNLFIRGRDIMVSSENPINGQDVSVTVTVRNSGGSCTAVLSFYDEVGATSTLINNRTYNFTIADSPAQFIKTITFKARGGGPHIINISAYPVDVIDAEPENNYNYTDINVMPTILLVDDDAQMADGSPYDTVSFMRAALDSGDFHYDYYIVNPGYDGPDYNFGEKALKNYDIVIWLCGYENSGTLTATDRTNLGDFLSDSNGNGTNGGSLWLIGQNVLADNNIPASFFTDNLTLLNGPPLPTADPGPTNPLMGVAGNNISEDWAPPSKWISIVDRIPSEDHSYIIEPDTAVGANITFLTQDSRADAINHEDNKTGARQVFFPWEFSRIERNSDQAQVAFRVIMWLGNISMKFGRDLAVSDQTTEPTYVFFNQYVNVTAAIRNNGGKIESNIDAVLVVDGVPMVGTHYIDNITIDGMGGTVMISTQWKAESLGLHVLKWQVDPHNHIAETNEHNNMVSSYVSTGEVFVKFRILVVDDDGSANNNNGNPTGLNNETKYLVDAISRLGYEYQSPNGTNTTYVVNVGQRGPTNETLQDYSAVFWVTGSDANGILGGTDNVTLRNYLLNSNGRVWLIGENLGISGMDLSAVMGIQSMFLNAGLSGNLMGVDDSSISHGMEIPLIASATADVLAPAAGAEGVFYQNHTAGDYCAVLYDEGSYQSITFAFNLSAFYGADPDLISGDNALDEVTYLALHWFGKPDTRKEARITTRDISVSDSHPLIGNAYILRATVHNVGSQSTNLLVRFMDGNVQIGADSISIEPDQSTSAEIIWRPIFAGERTISVLADPIDEVAEIFEWFNNNVSFNIFVYFFWDDMESGAEKWSHESTILNINGESALDYFSAEMSLSTNISTEWDWSLTIGVENTTVTAKSYPKSFYLEEPSGSIIRPATIDVVFVFDTSNSMGVGSYPDRPIDFTKAAALTLVQALTDDSRVAIFQTQSSALQRQVLPYTYLDIAGRALIESTDYLGATGAPSNKLNPSGWTNIWLAFGEGIAYSEANSIQENVVVALSDGQDYQGSDTSIQDPPHATNDYPKVEMGSASINKLYGYCPWTAWGLLGKFDYHWGKYFGDNTTDGYWYQQDFGALGGSKEDWAYGLLQATMPVYTVGLSLETATTPLDINNPNFQISSYGGTTPPYQAQDPVDIYNGPEGNESGTPEFNLWRIATTSDAIYYYASQPDDLIGIFTNISQVISSGVNQTRSGTPAPAQNQATTNFDKAAVTETVNLENLETAKLSFWHKYNMVAGANGGFLQVGYKDGVNEEADGWAWKYVIPSNAYTGNLLYDVFVYDSFGHRVFWCWNGLSGTGEFTWDYTEVDLLSYVPEAYRDEVKVKFNYTQFGGGTGVGWYLDDVRLTVSRPDTIFPVNTTQDIWNLTNVDSHGHGINGNYSWSNVDPRNDDYMKPGIDNSLVTAPIDLTNAKNAYLSAYFKFNINYAGGAPPDGFRVEVTNDGGLSWTAINLGVRSSWGVSGTGLDNDDGNATDGKSYTGLPDSGEGQAATDGYWVHASTLSRLNVDLSAWMGNQIYLRFRVVTSNHPDYEHNNSPWAPDPVPMFGGFYVDDVIVSGETIFG